MLCANCNKTINQDFYRALGTTFCSKVCGYKAGEGLFTIGEMEGKLIQIEIAPKCGNTSKGSKEKILHSKYNKSSGEVEQENHYKCYLECDNKVLTVNVFTRSIDKQVIKELAIQEAIRFQKELGFTYSSDDINPVGFRIIRPMISNKL